MARLTAAWIFIIITILPMAVFANPNVASPEPSFWLFVLVGALPLLAVVYKQWYNARAKRVEVESNTPR